MRNRLIVVVVVLVFLAAGGWYKYQQNRNIEVAQNTSQSPQDFPADAVTITMRVDDYQPSEVTIRKGQTVVFVNETDEWRWPASNLHPTHDIYPEFDPKEPIGPKKSWAFRFESVGTWRMHDHLAPYITGTIIVK